MEPLLVGLADPGGLQVDPGGVGEGDDCQLVAWL